MWHLALDRLLYRVFWIGILVLALPLVMGLLARIPIFFSPDPDDSRGESAEDRDRRGAPPPDSWKFELTSGEPREGVGEK